MKKSYRLFAAAAATIIQGFVFISSSYALNIVLANDDSFETTNVQQLKVALENAGHSVLVSVPCAHQSGKGGSLGSYLIPVPVHPLVANENGVLTVDDDAASPDGYCVGDLEVDKELKLYSEFVDGTPVQAALHGIYKANEIWGSNPDLLISGPNEGQNVGFSVFISGTLGAAHAAILNDIPAVAVSAGSTPTDETEALNYAKLVAEKTLEIVTELESKARHGKALLRPKTGLTVNLPNPGTLSEDTEYIFTEVNWYTGSAIVFGNLGESGGYGSYYGYTEDQGLYGLNFLPGQDVSGDSDPKSEGNAVEAGYISISVIDATENAPKDKEMRTKRLLKRIVF